MSQFRWLFRVEEWGKGDGPAADRYRKCGWTGCLSQLQKPEARFKCRKNIHLQAKGHVIAHDTESISWYASLTRLLFIFLRKLENNRQLPCCLGNVTAHSWKGRWGDRETASHWSCRKPHLHQLLPMNRELSALAGGSQKQQVKHWTKASALDFEKHFSNDVTSPSFVHGIHFIIPMIKPDAETCPESWEPLSQPDSLRGDH